MNIMKFGEFARFKNPNRVNITVHGREWYESYAKKPQHAEIQRQTEEFLARGGKIETLPAQITPPTNPAGVRAGTLPSEAEKNGP